MMLLHKWFMRRGIAIQLQCQLLVRLSSNIILSSILPVSSNQINTNLDIEQHVQIVFLGLWGTKQSSWPRTGLDPIQSEQPFYPKYEK